MRPALQACQDRQLRELPRLLVFALVVAMVVAQFGLSVQARAADDPYEPVLPAVRDTVVQRTEGKVSSYEFKLQLDQTKGTISGTQRVMYVNETGQSQQEIPFRLYPNANYYGEGSLNIERVRVNGARVTPSFAEEDTVMTVPLAAPLPPGDQVSIALRYTVTVPADSQGTFGIFSRDTRRGMWVLADWYPILAGWEPGTGWRLDPPSPYGDPTFSEVALYDVSLTMPAGWSVAASGTETPTGQTDGQTRWEIVSGPAREFTMVVDDDFVTASRSVDGTKVTVFTDGSGDAAAGGEIALDTAADELRTYSDAFGAYPYDELDLVETEMPGALGVSWTGVVFLNSTQLLANPYYVQEQPGLLRFTVAHEVGHQWWGALVGVNSNDHTFLLEGLTNYLAVVATERTEGVDAARAQLDVQCVQPYLRALAQYGDGIADAPISVESSGPPRGALIYGKAALGFLAIREAIGDDAFFAAIRTWADRFSYGIAEPVDLRDAFNAASDKRVDDLWHVWFESADTTPADVQALIGQ